VLSEEGSLPAAEVVRGFTATLERCPGCEVVATRNLDPADDGVVVASETAELLEQFPETTHLFAPLGPRVAPIVIGARQAGRPDLRIASTQADASGLGLMKVKSEPRLDASNTVPERWAGWAAFDQLLRVIAGQDLVEHPVPIMLRTRANADAPFFKPLSRKDAINFKARYKDLWGVR